MSAARGIAIAGALIGAYGLTLQYAIIYDSMSADAGALAAVSRYFAYFTILTNAFVTLVFARAALRPGSDSSLNAPRVELMAVTSILFVCIVYNVLLAPRWSPQGWQLAADIIVHQIVPGLFALYWVLRAHGRLTWTDAGFAALWPLAYAAYGLARGRIDGFYPYFFMDPTSASWGQIALNLAGLVASFIIGALVVIAIDGALGRRARPAV